ncbi:hypothetical protein Ga0466249_004815 [Sporomusaceae bacterium BoRhaA]|uniref:hypothetical protein n=1 Tax=Pelorhabdus rhamnosifermentans TaxID=2772457 RepID=UPI001C0643DA|nr:hypothetical protein [Pelorhabdus rhamnosifermentans]MBU2703667.1 hypothetical protein [Pelorhabdus rhamnosifermentans]
MSEGRCDSKFPCGGDCWLNVAGDYAFWEMIANRCTGTLEEQKINDDYFNGRITEKQILNFYGLETTQTKGA